MNEAEHPRLRVGLLIDGTRQPAWAARAIRDIVETDDAELVLVIRRQVRDASRTVTPQTLLWHAFQAVDRRVFRASPDPFEPVDVGAVLSGAPTTTVTGGGDELSAADVDAILVYQLDVAVDLGSGTLRGRALEIARLGVWSYHHGDSRVIRSGPSGYWEVARQHAVTGSELQVQSGEPAAGRVIYRSWAGTDRRSVVRNNGHRYWKSAAFVRRALRVARDLGPDESLKALAGSGSPGTRVSRAPRNRDVAATVLSIGARFVLDKVPDLFTRDQWTLAYGMTEPPRPDALLETAARLTPLLPPPDRFWADPFVLPSGGGWVLFFEELPFATGKGHISAIEIARNGTRGTPFTVLERDYHLSYPFVFEWNGETWMIPETRVNGTVELYRAVDFPRDWVFDRVLLDGVNAVDATLAEIGGRWWMFVGLGEPGAWTDDELHLYHADTPLGPWTPHRHDPVKSDVRSARPAGRPFLHDGAWYRPAQDCSTRYGAAIVINRIERITETEYREVEVSRLDPVWRSGLDGTHTINFAGGLTVIDARVRRRRSSRAGRAG